jgi:hypothetical protein
MCTRITCPRCDKPSYVGCGAHVEQVLGDVPKAERCRCREEATSHPVERGRGEREPHGLWKRLLG